MTTIKTFLLSLRLLYAANWYQGVDKPNLWQRFYKWRIGFKTAYKVANIRYE